MLNGSLPSRVFDNTPTQVINYLNIAEEIRARPHITHAETNFFR